jgi:hypothetical protein
MNLKELIKQLTREIIAEDPTGLSAAGPTMTPNWVAPKGQDENKATKTAKKQGFTITKESNYTKGSKYTEKSGFTDPSPSSRPSLYLQKSEYTSENMNEAPEQKKGKRYIPDQFEFPEFLLKPITIGQEEPRVYFKIVSKGDESVLMIDPLVGVALGAIQRGRTSFGSHHDLPALTRYMQEKVPGSVRGLVKKYSTGADIQSNGFMALPLVMTKKQMSGSSTGNNIVKINDKGINTLKAIKANPSKADGFEDELQFLVYLYKNKETTPKEYASAVGVSSMLASRIANTLSTQGAIDMETVQNTGVEGDTWYIVNPFKGGLTPDINTPMYETLMNIVKEELLNEVTYHKFKNEIKFRTKNEQLHRAIREVKRKLSEIDRIVEYTSLMKQELSENEAGTTYWKATQKNVTTIAEMVNQLNNKIKNLQQ